MKKEYAVKAHLKPEPFDLRRELAKRGGLESAGDDEEPHLRALLSVGVYLVLLLLNALLKVEGS
jgi:hypothetical protein